MLGFLGDVLWPDMCEDISTMLHDAKVHNEVEVVCAYTGLLTVEQEIIMVKSSPLIIAAHGTLSLLGMFASDDTVVLSVGENDGIKCPNLMLYASHIHVLFTTVERRNELPQLLRYGLHLAATHFHLPFPYTP
jgi:hypothetical protein